MLGTDGPDVVLNSHTAAGSGNVGWCIHGVPYGENWRCGMCGSRVTVNYTTERPRRRHITGRISPLDRAGKQYEVDLWVEDVP